MATAILAQPSARWCAVRCGARRERKDGAQVAQALGCRHATPYAATLPPIVRHVHREACEAHLGAWADRVVGHLPPRPATPETAVALEGHTLRGSQKPGAPGPPLYSALAPHGGVTLAHHAINDPPHASTAVETRVGQGALDGCLVTMDVLLTPRHIAQTIGAQEGDEVVEGVTRLRPERTTPKRVRA